MEFQLHSVLISDSLAELNERKNDLAFVLRLLSAFPSRSSARGPQTKRDKTWYLFSRDGSLIWTSPRSLSPPRRLSPSGAHEYANKGKILKGAGAIRRSLPRAARPVAGPKPGPLLSSPSLRAETSPACRTNYPTKSVSSRTYRGPRLHRTLREPVSEIDAGRREAPKTH